MRRSSVLLILASLALVAGFAVYVLCSPSGGHGNGAPEEGASGGAAPGGGSSRSVNEPREVTGTTSSPAPIATSPATAQGLASGDFELRGWVSTADQTPVQGAVVELFADPEGASAGTQSAASDANAARSPSPGGERSDGNAPSLGSATTDAEGRFRLPARLAEHPRPYRVVARSSEGSSAVRSFTSQTGQPRRFLHLVLRDVLDSLSVQTVTADGKPVAGIRLTARTSGDTAETDAEGIAAVAVDSRLLTHELLVASPGSDRFGVRIRSKGFPNRTNPLARIPVGVSTSVAGHVVDSRGAPVSEATVFAAVEQRFALTDAQGHFRLPLASEPDHALILEVSHPRFRRHEHTVSPAAASGFVELRLDAGFDLRGRILLPDDAAAVGAEVTASHDGASVSAVSDAEGGFGFTGLVPGRWTIVARVPSTGLGRSTTAVVPAPSAGILLRLEPGPILRGRVVDEQGNSVGGAWVEAQDGTGEVLDGTFCNAEGTYEFTAPSGVVTLAAKKPGYLEARENHQPNREVVLVLETGTPLRGVALDSRTNAPIREFTLTITPSPGGRPLPNRGSGPVTARITADDSGHFTTAPGVVPRGESYLVRATTPGAFAIPPATAELMYEPDSLGATEPQRVVVR